MIQLLKAIPCKIIGAFKSVFEYFLGALNGFRKFSFVTLCAYILVEFRLQNLIDGAQFVDALKVLGGAFIGGNTIEHGFKAVQAWLKK